MTPMDGKNVICDLAIALRYLHDEKKVAHLDVKSVKPLHLCNRNECAQSH